MPNKNKPTKTKENNEDKEKIKVIQNNQTCSITMGNFFYEDCPPFICNNDDIYIYNKEEHIYEPFNKDIFYLHLRAFVLKYSAYKIWKSSRMNEIYIYLTSNPQIKSVTLDDYTNLICLRNGVFDLSTNTLLPHSKDYYFSTKIDLDYDPEQTNCPIFQKYLETTFNNSEEQINLVLEMCGYLLHPSCRSEVMFFLDGPGGAGKTTLIKTLKMFFSKKQQTSFSIHQLASGGFDLSLLIDARINFCGEAKKNYLDTEEIKKMVSQDDIIISRKYKEALNFTPKLKIVVACNGLPKIKDTSNATFRRLVIINFNKQFQSSHTKDRIDNSSQDNIEEADNDLITKIRKEKTAIFNYFLSGLASLKERDWFFKDTSQSLKSLKDYRRDCDPIREFLEDNYTLPTDTSETSTQYSTVMNVYNHYKRWHEENIQEKGSFKLRSSEIGKRIKDVFNADQLTSRKLVFDIVSEKYIRRTVYPIIAKVETEKETEQLNQQEQLKI